MRKSFSLISAIFLSAGFIFFANSAKAQVFEIHLYYNPVTDELKFDEKAQKPVTYNEQKFLSITEYIEKSEKSKGSYVLYLLEKDGSKLISTEFDPGQYAFVIEVPYYGLAHSLSIHDKKTDALILNVDLEEYQACNANGICEYEAKESLRTCLNDCHTGETVKYSQDTLNLLRQNKGIVKDPSTGENLLYDKRFADNSPVPPPTTPGLSAPNPSTPSASPSQGQEEPRISYVKLTLLAIFVLIASSILFYFIRKKIKNS